MKKQIQKKSQGVSFKVSEDIENAGAAKVETILGDVKDEPTDTGEEATFKELEKAGLVSDEITIVLDKGWQEPVPKYSEGEKIAENSWYDNPVTIKENEGKFYVFVKQDFALCKDGHIYYLPSHTGFTSKEAALKGWQEHLLGVPHQLFYDKASL